MALLYEFDEPKTLYWDKRSASTRQQWEQMIKNSNTVYVGNLSFYSSEDQIYELFSKCGMIVQVVMGLNKYKKVPCGFAFVRFSTHEEAKNAVELLNQTMCDGRTIRVDWDSGQGIDSDRRSTGRSVSGNQWRDLFRWGYDPGREMGGGVDFYEWNEKARQELYMRRDSERYLRKRPISGRMEAYRPHMTSQSNKLGAAGTYPVAALPHVASVPFARDQHFASYERRSYPGSFGGGHDYAKNHRKRHINRRDK